MGIAVLSDLACEESIERSVGVRSDLEMILFVHFVDIDEHTAS